MALMASDCYRLKVLLILETAGERVLTYTLKCGTNGKSPAVPLDQYLENLPSNSTSDFNRRVLQRMKKHPKSVRADICKALIGSLLTPTDISQITHDASCTTFDITLLHKVIKLSCENVAETSAPQWKNPSSDELEPLVTRIKDARNETVHEKMRNITHQEFLQKVDALRITFTEALKATKVRYNRDMGELINEENEVMKLIDAIMKENIGIEEILQKSAGKLLPLFKIETDRELREKLKGTEYLDPLHFLIGQKGKKVNIANIFTKITIEERKDEEHSETTKNECNYIEYLKLLTSTFGQLLPQGRACTRSQSPCPKMLLVEGDAGSGKTTLLTFVLAEWFKERCDRRFEGLQDYDLVLWVVCREQSSDTLLDLVAKLLPEAYVKYNNLLLPLLKQCKILFLIDGIDERNENSRKLIIDILSHGEHCPNFSLVCTSRPERVLDMKGDTPKKFLIFHVKMVGISVDDRTEFVVKHYNWLTRGTRDTAPLRQLMFQIVWRKLFRLPLNLLFLSTLYYFKPQNVTPTIKQSELYQFIHEWSVEKLLHRLIKYRQTKTRHAHERSIEKVLSVIKMIALNGLLHGTIYLSDDEENLLYLSCRGEDLPEDEVMQAFYSLRREVRMGKVTERYCAPHKGVQEFLAARNIIENLQMYKQGDIRDMLQKLMPEQEVDLVPLRNMFCHLIGLLNGQNDPMVTALDEAVDLIWESGMANTDDWLNVLADTEAHPKAMQRVAHHIRTHPDYEIIVVEDGTLDIAKVLLPLVPQRTIEIMFRRERSDVYDLIPALAHHTVTDVWQEHHYKHLGSITSEHLLQLLPR